MNNEKGLTLIELLAVIIIIAIIAAIAVPTFAIVINNSKDKAILADASNIIAASRTAVVEGICSESVTGTDTTKSCTQDNLKEYIEQVKFGRTYSTVFTGSMWTVTYEGLADLKNEDLIKEISGSGKTSNISEAKLNKLMDNKSK